MPIAATRPLIDFSPQWCFREARLIERFARLQGTTPRLWPGGTATPLDLFQRLRNTRVVAKERPIGAGNANKSRTVLLIAIRCRSRARSFGGETCAVSRFAILMDTNSMSARHLSEILVAGLLMASAATC